MPLQIVSIIIQLEPRISPVDLFDFAANDFIGSFDDELECCALDLSISANEFAALSTSNLRIVGEVVVKTDKIALTNRAFGSGFDCHRSVH
jgi:hypothetical protein